MRVCVVHRGGIVNRKSCFIFDENVDTDYKKSIFDFCNKLGRQKDWRELNLEFARKKIEFQVVFEDEWKVKINKIFGV